VSALIAVNGSGHLLGQPATRNRYTEPSEEPCWHCHRPRDASHPWALRGLCSRCYRRWADHGFDTHAPPEPRTTHRWVITDPELLAEFARRDRPDIPGRSAELARRFGVSRKTLSRMRKRVAQQRERERLITTAAEVCGRQRWRNRLRPGARQGGERTPNVGDPVAAMVAAETHDQGTRSVARATYFRA